MMSSKTDFLLGILFVPYTILCMFHTEENNSDICKVL